ncbi:S1 RNA-binding domain-containing protein [Fervidibacillus albus]|uniref:S1-like domain-containing RNA-binding protein n=1 Tax=Fervidibacillus albus TaxID=2980026 RepID=A0A9E8RUU6_9BACI|nr:S1-like domain-containing RNA-binding protein [Fervidibacillus albus]WAA08624.1 S1-like domain-containing RNA-binding protein [Fervidibacillus albus]
MEKLLPGKVVQLTVVREAPFGFFLSSGKQDVLLHESQIVSELEPGKTIDVFLYRDREGRLAATETIPDVRIGSFGWCKVTDIKSGLGVFIDIGIGRDVLLHENDLPKVQRVWPDIGGKLYCTLKLDKYDNLLAKLANEKDMEPLFKRASKDVFNRDVEGIVYRTLRSGTFVITEEGYRGFIHESQRGQEPRIGSNVRGRVIGVKDDGTVNVSLLPRSYEAIAIDADKIYRYLLERGGTMPYTDKSRPEDIEKRFGMSKAAFKRAIGRLMKEKKIVQENGWTKITARENNEQS